MIMPAGLHTLARLALTVGVAGFGALCLRASASQLPRSGNEPRQENPSDRPTFRTSATLVTVDAVVTDKDGRHVTGLTSEDFEIVHKGRRQRVQHALYVPLHGGMAEPVADAAPRAAAPPSGEPVAPLTSALERRQAIRRTIAIVVDDLGLSFESTAHVRRALRRLVDEQIQPGDLVAIIRTSGGIGALQQFTTDKRLLRAAVDRVRWTVASRSGVAAFAPIEPRDRFTVHHDPTRAVGSPERGKRALGTSFAEDLSHDGIRHAVLAAGSLAALDFVVRGVERLPGRKAVVFVSEGFDLFDRRGQAQIYGAFTRLMDHANRAGVVVYTLDGRGLETGGLSAEDHPQNAIPMPGDAPEDGDRKLRELILAAQDGRHALRRNTEEALHYLAWQTGGLAILNSNDLRGSLGRILNDLQGYYLLGYEAPPGTSRNWEPDRLSVRVRRPGLRVRWRQGFFGPSDPRPSQDDEPGDPLLMAALSPFGASAIAVRLTALFGHDAETGPYVRTMLFVDANGLTFTRGEGGTNEAGIEIAQVAVGDNGEVLGNWRRTVTFSLTGEQLADARAGGVVYGTRMAIRHPGGYQVRTAVRDAASGRLGSASQFLEVPEVGRGRLAMSGLLLQAEPIAAAGTLVPRPQPEGGRIHREVLGKPPLRIFQPGASVAFAYELYDGASQDDPLVAEAALLRDGRIVFRGPAEPIERPKSPGASVRVIPVGGRLSLGAQVPPGAYTLEVSVRSGRKRHAQWVDFEVRPLQ